MYSELGGTVEAMQGLTSGESSVVSLTLSLKCQEQHRLHWLKNGGECGESFAECSPELVALEMPGNTLCELAGAPMATTVVLIQDRVYLCAWHQWVQMSWAAESQRPWVAQIGWESGHESVQRVAWVAVSWAECYAIYKWSATRGVLHDRSSVLWPVNDGICQKSDYFSMKLD